MRNHELDGTVGDNQPDPQTRSDCHDCQRLIPIAELSMCPHGAVLCRDCMETHHPPSTLQ